MENISEKDLIYWNNYISPINMQVIALDNDKEKQRQFIDEKYAEMKKDPYLHFNLIFSWYQSQRQIIGEPMFDFECLYPWSMSDKCKFL